MSGIRFWLMIPLLLLAGASVSAELQRVVLHDGSIINAEVVSLNDGVYRLSSPALGEFDVRASRIRSIQAVSGATPSTVNAQQISPGAQQVDIDRIQSSLSSNKDTVAIIIALQNDPDVQAILADREIMAALQSGNYDALLNNPKIISLMSKPEIRQITKESGRIN
jgi:hypothetical protein